MPRPAPVTRAVEGPLTPGSSSVAHAGVRRRESPGVGGAGAAASSGRRSVNVLPCARGRAEVDGPAVGRGQAARDGQAQAGAAALARGVAAVEAVEHEGLGLGRDALARCRAPPPSRARRRRPPRPPPGRPAGVWRSALSSRISMICSTRGRRRPRPRPCAPRPTARAEGTPARSASGTRGATTSATSSARSTAPRSERDGARVEAGELELLLHQPLEPGGLLGHRREELAAVALADPVALQQLQEALERGDRRLELVGDVGHQVAPGALQPALVGDVAQRHDHPGVGVARQPGGVQLQLDARPAATISRRSDRRARRAGGPPARRRGSAPAGASSMRLSRALGEPQVAVGGVVGQRHGAVGGDGEHALGQGRHHRAVAVALAR